jgi:hypothetical protein
VDAAVVTKAAREWHSEAKGKAIGVRHSRCVDDYHGREPEDDDETQSIIPALLQGKVTQATLFAIHAYAKQEDFRSNTGLQNACLLTCDERDTQVPLPDTLSPICSDIMECFDL